MNTLLWLGKNITSSIFTHNDDLLKKRFFDELNEFRRQPSSLISYLQQRKKNYSLDEKGKILFSPNHPNKGLETVQGNEPIVQLQKLLNQLQPLPTFTQNSILSLISQNLAQTFTQIKQPSQIKLTQSHSKSLRQQLNNSTSYDFVDKITCLIGIGFDGDEYQPLLSLLVDDGDKKRENREMLMNRNLSFVGIGTTKLRYKQQLRVVVYLLTGSVMQK